MGRGRKPKCKNCAHFKVLTDEYGEDYRCDLINDFVLPDDAPSCNGSFVRREKKRVTQDELSRIRSAAGRKGGRKAGYGKGRAPTNTVTIRHGDYLVFNAYAGKRSLAEMFHQIAKSIIAKHPELKPPEWIS